MREICMSGSMSGFGNGVMGEARRHRQTKEAATDMFSLPPPRHISTLPRTRSAEVRRRFPVIEVERTLRPHSKETPDRNEAMWYVLSCISRGPEFWGKE